MSALTRRELFRGAAAAAALLTLPLPTPLPVAEAAEAAVGAAPGLRWYVAAWGSDEAIGDVERPLASFEEAYRRSEAGDVVVLLAEGIPW